MSSLEHFLFGIYPYIALSVFLLGSLLRFDREQYSWRSESSQMLSPGLLRWGSNLFHLGVLGLFFGHAVGMLTPKAVFHALGVTAAQKQMLAIGAGGVLGSLCLVGLLLLIVRRLGNERLRAVSRPMDYVVQFWLLATLLLGLSTLPLSVQHSDGATMLQLMGWAQSIVTFQGGSAGLLQGVSAVFKLHMFMGMTLFAIFPFSRLVHVWSGFASVGYVLRPYQLVRSRRLNLPREAAPAEAAPAAAAPSAPPLAPVGSRSVQGA
ncbi:respiratory nitrate reductase subunit gamma [Eleftheria terrae]|uniref:respiratory nitrate reductase subunit gamma n=1 Tax=Eleftheria terrae TaxID=1597781 RepID=UPI0034283875